MTTIQKFRLILKHLIWNASASKGKTYWMHISEEEAKEIIKDYKIIELRSLPKGVKAPVVEAENNLVVLDPR